MVALSLVFAVGLMLMQPVRPAPALMDEPPPEAGAHMAWEASDGPAPSLVLVAEAGGSPPAAGTPAREGWVRRSFAGMMFETPEDWELFQESDEEVAYGEVNQNQQDGVVMGVTLDRNSFDSFMAEGRQQGFDINDLGTVMVGDQVFSRFEAQASQGGMTVALKGLYAAMPNDRGRYVMMLATVMNRDPAPYADSLEHFLASARPAAANETVKSADLDGLAMIDAPAILRKDVYRPDDGEWMVEWTAPEARDLGKLEYRIALVRDASPRLFFVGDRRVRPARLGGLDGLLFEGAGDPWRQDDAAEMGATYKRVFLSETCLADGRRIMVYLNADPPALDRYGERLAAMDQSLRLVPPEDAASCGEWTAHTWNGVSLALPRGWWTRETNPPDESAEWRTFDPEEGSVVSLTLRRLPSPGDSEGRPATVGDRPALSMPLPDGLGTRYALTEPIPFADGQSGHLEVTISVPDRVRRDALGRQPLDAILDSIRVGSLAAIPDALPSEPVVPAGWVVSDLEDLGLSLATPADWQTAATDDATTFTDPNTGRMLMVGSQPRPYPWARDSLFDSGTVTELGGVLIGHRLPAELIAVQGVRAGQPASALVAYAARPLSGDAAPLFALVTDGTESGPTDTLRSDLVALLGTVSIPTRPVRPSHDTASTAPATREPPDDTAEATAAAARVEGERLQAVGNYADAIVAYRKSIAAVPDDALLSRIETLERYLAISREDHVPAQ